jgi:hypothetical protein
MAVNGKSRRSYRGAPISNTLGLTLNAGATSITLAVAVAGWSTDGEPFFVVVDPGTSKEEKICVKYATSTTLTVVDPAATSTWGANADGRGFDNTTDQAHSVGAVIYPVFTATEANQNNELVSKYANAGSVVYQGSGTPGTFTELAIGTASQVLTVNSGATAPQWSAIVNANVSASAAIALSKLATGALPTDITIASANLVDGTIVAADLADAAVTSPKLAAPTLTAKTDSFTLALVDANCTIQCTKATDMTVTVPDSSIAFTVGTVVTLVNLGSAHTTFGVVTIGGASGVNVRSSNGLKLRTQYSAATLVKISDTAWVLTGDTVA